MYPKKLRRQLILIACTSFMCLLINICGCAYLHYRQKSLEENIPVIRNVQAVPLQLYKDSLESIKVLELGVLPAFSCGYYVIGLLILRHYEKTKNL